jgi:hypothetical protein
MRKKLIKAYHQVGGDDRTPAQRKAFLNQILDLGEIVPAIQRIQRREMYNECFTEESQGGQRIEGLLHGSGPEAREALTLMAREKLALLPEDGSTHTMFNCLDLIAGDFERVFMSIGDWYSAQNGFVFDAEELLMAGASYRPRDLLGYYGHRLEKAVGFTYDSVEDARRELESVFESVRDDHETTGKAGVTLLRADCGGGTTCPGEIVWPGFLPLGLAIEMWREGRKVEFREGARR